MRLDYALGKKFIKVIEETHPDIFPAGEVSSRDNFMAFASMTPILKFKIKELKESGVPLVLATISSKYETSIESSEYGPRRVFCVYWPAQGKE
jgi:hypothetical protein